MKNGYIVANKEQEFDVLKKLEQEGFKWYDRDLPTKFIFSEGILFSEFPYIISEYKDIGYVGWSYYSENYDGKIVYDGRKEEKMTEVKKYKVTKEFMNALEDWKEILKLDNVLFVGCQALSNLPSLLNNWWRDGSVSAYESNNRLIAIIKWLNGEDVFEVEAPHNFVVRSEDTDGKNYNYVKVSHRIALASYRHHATKFDTREEAQEWANSHQVVVEIDEDGNEVE